MKRVKKVDVLLIGHFAKDEIVYLGKKENALGGAVYYGSIALSRLGFSVGVVTRLAESDFDCLEDMIKEGVHLFATKASATTGIQNVYETEDMNHRTCKILNFAGPFVHEDIPDIQSKITAICPVIAGEVNLELLNFLSSNGTRIALDAQGFVRVPDGESLVFKDWDQKTTGLKYVDVIKVDDVEAEVLTGESDLNKAAEKLAFWGPREVVLTSVEGLTVFADGHFYHAPYRPQNVKGRTGRGDTTLSTYIAKRQQLMPEEACLFAAATASLKMEYPGPFRGNEAEVLDFIAMNY